MFDDNPLCWTSVEGGLIARNPRVYEGKDTIYWSDLTHVRAYDVKRVLKNETDVFEFEDPQGRLHALRPLTLAKFNELKSQFNSDPNIRTEAQLQRHFLKDTLVQ